MDPLWLSLKVSVCAVAVMLIPAMGMGYVLARKSFPGKSLLSGVLHMSLVVPPVVTGYVLLLMFGRHGMIGQWLGWHIAFTWHAAVLACAVMAFPLMVRSIRVAIELVDPGLEAAARTLGANPWTVLCHVTMPLAWSGILSGVVLGFARSLGEFGATITFAGNLPGKTQTLSLAIFTALQQPGADHKALGLVGLSLAVSLCAIVMSETLSRRAMLRLKAG